nr:MAG TPA_asm: hypothetical protein [Caudoviricetes sp.]
MGIVNINVHLILQGRRAPHLSANEWAETGIRQTQHEAQLKAMNFSRRKANK